MVKTKSKSNDRFKSYGFMKYTHLAAHGGSYVVHNTQHVHYL